MNIQTVIANLLNTIEGKEALLAEVTEDLHGKATASLMVTKEFLELNIKELNAILADCMLVREADIVRNLEHKDSCACERCRGYDKEDCKLKGE